MPKTQPSPMSPQVTGEAGAADFATALQRNLEALFEAAHDHRVRTSAPASHEGLVGDIVLVDDGSDGKLYVKFPVLGWGYFTATF